MLRPDFVRRELPLQSSYDCHPLLHVIGSTVSEYYEVIRLLERLQGHFCLSQFWTLYLSLGAFGISRVHDASLVTCRSLRTPPALSRLTNTPSPFRFHARYHADQSGTTFRSDTNSKGLRPHPAYNIPCVRFTSFVRACRSLHHSHRSARGATLGNGGWLTLTMPGLAPDQIRHALRGALTTKLTGGDGAQRNFRPSVAPYSVPHA